jgi:hypothetical protein
LNLAETEGIRGRYNKPKRDLAQIEIRRLISFEGLSNQQISDRLQIPLKTVERYVKDIYARDNDFLRNLTGENEVLTQVNIARDRYESHRQEILNNIIRNPKSSDADKLRAWNIVCELEAADFRMKFETPAAILRQAFLPESERRSSYDTNNMLILKKEEEEEQDLGGGGAAPTSSPHSSSETEEWIEYEKEHGIITMGRSDDPKFVQEQGYKIEALHKEWLKEKETPEYKQKWRERRIQERLRLQLQSQKQREEEDKEILKIMNETGQKLPEDPEQAKEVMELHRRWLQRKKSREEREARAKDSFGFD